MNKDERLYKKPYIPAEYVPQKNELNDFCEKSLQKCLNNGDGYASCISRVNSDLLNTYGNHILKPNPTYQTFNKYRDYSQ
jgi:hypothetical protein